MRDFNVRVPARLIASALLAFCVSYSVNAAVEIEHKPVKKTKSGTRIPLSAKIEDEQYGMEIVRTYFKAQQEARYYFIPMQLVEGGYIGVLPAASLGTRFIDYLILAKNGAKEVVKSQNFIIEVDDDEAALARLQKKPPRDIHLDLDEYKRVKDAIKKKDEYDEYEPDPGSRVPVETGAGEVTSSIPGFDDFIVLKETDKAAVLGVGSATSTVVASTGGLAWGTIGLGALAVGGIAAGAAALSGGGDDGGGGTSSTPAPPSTSPGVTACDVTNVAGGNTPETRTIELGKTSGTFQFSWEMFTQEDSMTVSYEGQTLPDGDTGCVSGSGLRQISYGGNSTRVTVSVTPNCMDPGNTAWNFTVTCP